MEVRGDVSGDNEIRLFDPRRDPRDWTDLIRPTQCVVFLKDRTTSTSLTPDGKPYARPADTTCLVFDRVDAAQQFSEMKVQAIPYLRCEIYDAQGLAHPPLLVIVHPNFQHQEDSDSFWSRRRKLIALVLFLMAPPLIWIDMRRANTLILPTFHGFHLHPCRTALSLLGFWRETPRAGAAKTAGGPSADGARRCLS